MSAPYTESSLILRKATIEEFDLDALDAWAVREVARRTDFLSEYLSVVMAGGIRLGIDPWIVIGQSHLETAGWTSPVFVAKGNPAGIGVTGYVGGPSDSSNSQTFANGTEAAMGHLAHLVAYLWPEDWANSNWPGSWPWPWDADKRFDAPGLAGYMATDLASLGRQRYADGMWRGWSDNDYDYGKKIAERANLIAGVARKDVPVTDGNIVFGRVPHPPFEDHIIRKDANHGVTLISGSRGQPKGCVHHEWMDGGEAGEQFYKDFFKCPNGIRHKDACVDYFILRNGKIVRINDPKGNRIPWASGGAGPYQGDGGPFVRKFGSAAVNRNLVSWEYCKRNGDDLTAAQIQSGGALAAYWHDQDEQLWSEHPYTSKYGLVTSFLHYEFSATDCGKGELDDITKVQAVTKGIMKKYQTGEGGGDPVDPDVPTPPPVPIPGGITLAQAKERFGAATRRNKDGSIQIGLGFDPDGPISLTWAHRAAVEKEWPRIEDWYILDDSGKTLQIVTFSNDWRLIQVAERGGWEWVDYKEVKAA